MRSNSRWSSAFGLVLMIACVIACKAARTSTSNPAEAPTVNQTPATIATTPDIAGNYNVAGTNPNGTPYRGTLEVIKHGDVYQFRWNAGLQFDGVGVANGNIVAVAFANGPDGKGCGVVNYAIASDGTLNGKWGYWGLDESGTESARRTSGSGLAGTYEANGTNPDGKNYKGTMTVVSEGSGYKFSWSNGAEGFGIKQGDNVAVGIGGARCAFVSYQIKSDGMLDGIWGGSGSSRTGTEKATKR